MNIDELTLGQIREIQKIALGTEPCRPPSRVLPFGPGDKVLIRTVTMAQIGEVQSVDATFIVLKEGGWLADSGRFSECLATGKLNEFERAPSWIVVAIGAIVDVFPWLHDVPKETV